ncbi:hypothetical protein Agub_g3596 [Astrephomene gubernaculifera]|uniref:Plastid division protein CDP1-like 2nd alpha solenoid domain-containing protein n=1 Tax=Astrephomene gubernaculifera TaxID=47775 RepID=A0AAD3DIV9_9CHLO|nr:hypothetical protein Agub_g3596 [Astrephomene gubernaculifera]
MASLECRYRFTSKAQSGCSLAALPRLASSAASVVTGNCAGATFGPKAPVRVEPHGHRSTTRAYANRNQGAVLTYFRSNSVGAKENMPAATLSRHQDSVLLLGQEAFLRHTYSPDTVSAIARLLGDREDGMLLASGQDGVVVLSKTSLLDALKAGNEAHNLAEASAALALLRESGQYGDVVRYGTSLLKSAACHDSPPAPPIGATTPSSPFSLPSFGLNLHQQHHHQQQPLAPHQQQQQQHAVVRGADVVADVALSVALSHISLAAEAGGAEAEEEEAGEGGGGAAAGGLQDEQGEVCGGLEAAHGHLEAALQVLWRHGVSEALQQEVACCLQGVAVALAEELLRGTPPPPPPSSGGGGAQSLAAAARRARAVSLLRGALWSCSEPNTQHQQQQQQHTQQHQHQDPSHGAVSSSPASFLAAAAAGVLGPAAAAPGSSNSSSSSSRVAAESAASSSSAGSSTASCCCGPCWPPVLSAEERCELLAPLRGLLSAAEHISLYGPAANSARRPSSSSPAPAPAPTPPLCDQELYDLAVAHLAQGVATGWPQHVLQALSYFERVAHQQQQGKQDDVTAPSAAAAAADVSFERSVCEALLGRRSKAAGPEEYSSSSTTTTTTASSAEAAPAAATSLPASSGTAAAGSMAPSGVAAVAAAPAGAAVSKAGSSSGGGSADGSGGEEEEDEEVGLLRRLEAQLALAAEGADASAAAAALSFSVRERCCSVTGGHHSSTSSMDSSSSCDEDEQLETNSANPATAAAGNQPPLAALSAALGGSAAEGATAGPTAAAAATTADDHSHLHRQQHKHKHRHHRSHHGHRARRHRMHAHGDEAEEHAGEQEHEGEEPHRCEDDDEMTRQYGWAESWLELSVMPCFPETAAALAAEAEAGDAAAAEGAGVGKRSRKAVSLARWFQDPRVILFNKLLAVRSSEAQVSAALGSAVAHVSEASRQRLWQLWQAAAAVVAAAAARSSSSQHQQQEKEEGQGQGGLQEQEEGQREQAGGSGAAAAMGLLAQSRAALQGVGPRAAAAASAMAAAVGSAAAAAAATPPRAVSSAAANWLPPLGPLARWPGTGGGGGSSTATEPRQTTSPAAVAAGLLAGLRRAASGVVAAAAGDTALPPRTVVAGEVDAPWVGAGDRLKEGEESADVCDIAGGRSAVLASNLDKPTTASLQQQQRQGLEGRPVDTIGSSSNSNSQDGPSPFRNNVVPFPAVMTPNDGDSYLNTSSSGSGFTQASGATSPLSSSSAPLASNSTPADVLPSVSGHADSVTASTEAPAGASPAAPLYDVTAGPDATAAAAEAAAADAAASLWVPDAEGHLRPHMTARWRLVRPAGSKRASRGDGGGEANPWAAAVAAVRSRQAMRRVAAVAAQAACLGALAAFVGHRVITGGGGAGVKAAIEAAPPAVDAAAAQISGAARTVGRWLRGGGVAEAGPLQTVGQEAAGELVATAEDASRLAARYASAARLDEAAASALLRGWAAARAAAPGLTDPRDRSALLGSLLGGRALRRARAEADRDARMGRRVHLTRVEVVVEQLQQPQHPQQQLLHRDRTPSQAPSSQPGLQQQERDGEKEQQQVEMTAVLLTEGSQVSRAGPGPAAFSSRERLQVVVRREQAGAAAKGAGAVWRVVEVREAPPAAF